MAVSITCGGGKGDSEEPTLTGDTGDGATGNSVSGTESEPTGEPLPTTSFDPGVTTGAATASSVDTTDSTAATSTGEDATGADTEEGTDAETGSETTMGGSTTGGGAPQNATVDDSCAPDDGAALEFRIGVDEAVCESPWSGEQLRILLYQGGPLAPGVYPLDGGFGGATVGDEQDFVFGDAGTLTIESWAEDAVVGSYEVTFPDESVRSGSFVGPHCLTMPLCG